jgi:hypothetical protein
MAVLLTVGVLSGALGLSALATEIGNWTQASATDGDWTRGEIQATTTEELSSSSTTGSTTSANTITDPLSGGSITLDLTPGQETSVTGPTVNHLQVLSDLTGGSSDEPASVTQTSSVNEDGSVITTVTTTTALYGQDGKTVIGYQVTVTTTTASDGETVTADPETTTTVPAPTGYIPGTVTTPLTEDGHVIGSCVVTTTELTADDGAVVGYEVVTITTTDTDDATAEPGTTTALPGKPVASQSTEDGQTTTVRVGDVLDAQNNVVGYQVTTVLTDKDGSELSRIVETLSAVETTVSRTDDGAQTTVTETRMILGTAKNVTTTTTRTVNVTATESVETQTWKLQNDTDGLSYVYTGKMSAVRANSGNGMESTQSLQSDLAALSEDDANMLFDSSILAEKPLPSFDYTDYSFQYVDGIIGSALYSTYGNVPVYQYELVEEGSGRRHYVLCADLSVSPRSHMGYNMENVEDATYYSAADAAHIKAIALSGYWGTSSGIGSLAAVRSLLQEAGLSSDLTDLLTPGMALTATQAAVWAYGNSDASHTYDIYDTIHTYAFGDLTEDEQKVLFTLYELLVNMDPDSVTDTSSTIINQNQFATNASIVVKDKTTSAEDGTVYDTDISFTLGTVPTASDDLYLTVTVTDKDGVVVSTTTGALPQGTAWSDSKAGTNGQLYTLEDVQLPAGAKVTLTLTGTQILSQGVYLYTAGDYRSTQTFVGIASGTRKVDLSVDLSFQETAPTAAFQYTTASKTTALTGTRQDTKVDTVTYSLTTASAGTTVVPDEDPADPEEPSDSTEIDLPDGSEEDIIEYPDGVEVDVIKKPDHTITATVTVPDGFTPEQIVIPIDLGANNGTVSSEIIRPDASEEDVQLPYEDGAILVDVDGPMEIDIFDEDTPLSAMTAPDEDPAAAASDASAVFAADADAQPNTGDSRHLLLLLCLTLLSGSALAVLSVQARRDRR